MSFPPRPPMGLPTMGPPGMMPQGYGFAPMGMMPMGMGMMPATTMMRGSMTNTSTSSSGYGGSQSKAKKLVPQEIPKNSKDEKPPITTVFVGNISDRAPDAMVRQMLQRCGNVLSWKRVQGASGKLQAFGFCEYEDPEATLRCIRLLNEWRIVDKNLVVKVDAKTKTQLEDYKAKKKARNKERPPKEKDDEKENGEEKENGDETLDEFTLREDRVAKAGLDAIMREYSSELRKEPPPGSYRNNAAAEKAKEKEKQKKEKEKEPIKDQGLDDMEVDDDKKDLINREIKSFRDAHKDEDETEEDKDANRDRFRRRREEERERIRERERRDRERERERDRKERELRGRSRSRSHSRSRSRDRSRERSISSRPKSVPHRAKSVPDRTKEKDRRERDRDRELEDEEEAYERRKMERKVREKEAAYQERLKNWEARERKKAREYEKRREKEEEKKMEEQEEGRRLKEFLEDYDDERDDPKYYKGSALSYRLKEREKEIEADNRDRQREKEEIEEIRRKLLEEGHPDPEGEMAKIERERDEHLMPRLKSESESEPETKQPPVEHEVQLPMQQQQQHEPQHEPQKQREQPPQQLPQQQLQPPQQLPAQQAQKMQSSSRGYAEHPPSVSSQSSPDIEDPDDHMDMHYSEDSSSLPYPTIGPVNKGEAQQRAAAGFSSLRLGGSESPSDQHSNSKKKKLTVGDVFNQDDEVDSGSKKRKLVPLDYSEEEKAAVVAKPPTTAEEKRRHIKNLIERIPTGKEELFAFSLDWTMVDTTLMDRRIKPWVNKKIVEYIGEEEPTLTEFICQKVMSHSPPQSILGDVAMVLDEEAEVFVVKMWRLLIYETEAKKAGLVK